MRTYQEDREFGLKNESSVADAIATLFGDAKPIHSEKRYDPFDYYTEGKTHYAEVKTRRNTYKKYPTTLITAKKVRIAAADPTAEYYFVFNFEDGMYYIKYNAETFAAFECKEFKRFSRRGIYDQPADHIYIPIEALTEIKIESRDIEDAAD
jgi:hypothetical protein